MQIFLLSFISLLPVLFWILLWWFQDKEREPFKPMLISFLLGIGFAFLLMIFREELELWISSYSTHVATVVLAFIEEIGKALVLILSIELTRRWFTQIVDGLIYGAVVALGFAFAEMLFFSLSFSAIDMTVIFLIFLRSMNTIVAHSLFTALFGFFYASAYLRKDVFPEKKKEKPWAHLWKNIWEALPFHVTLIHLLPNRPSKHGHYPGSLLLEGILLAGLLHALFNLFLRVEWNGVQLGFLTFPLIFGLVYLVWKMFLAKVYTRIVKRIKN